MPVIFPAAIKYTIGFYPSHGFARTGISPYTSKIIQETTSDFIVGETIVISNTSASPYYNLNGSYTLTSKILYDGILYHYLSGNFSGWTISFGLFTTVSTITGLTSKATYNVTSENWGKLDNNTTYNYLPSAGENVRNAKSWIYSTTNYSWNSTTIPIGTIMQYSGFSAPNGWLICDGSEISTTTYQALYDKSVLTITGNLTSGSKLITNISSLSYVGNGMFLTTTSGMQSNTKIVNTSLNSITMNNNATATITNATIKILPFGSAASSSNFKIPDLRSRIPVGNIGNGSRSSDKVMGVTNGSENITLGIGEISSHSHGIQSETPHDHGGNTQYESNTHYHPSYMKYTSQEAGGYGLTAVAGFQNRVIIKGNPYDYPGAYSLTQASAQHYHSFTTAKGYTNINVQSAGSGGSHNNMHPYLPLNYIIKY